MDSLAALIFCVIFGQVFGAPASLIEDYLTVPNDCTNDTNQIYDTNFQKCAYIVGSSCNTSAINFEINGTDSSILAVNCVSNAECDKESSKCQCTDGYEETETLECYNKPETTNNYLSDSEFEDQTDVTILYGKFCDNSTDCDATEKLVCADLSENSTSSICVCQNSTYVYQAGLGCILPYGMRLSDLLIIKETMRRFRRQRELSLLANLTSGDLRSRQGAVATEASIKPKPEVSTTTQYQILDRNQYQPQNLFGQPPQNFQNNPFQNPQNPQNPSSQEITSNYQNQNPPANNFPNQNPTATNFPSQNTGINIFPNQNPGINNYPNQNPGINNYPNQNVGISNFPNQNVNSNNIQNGQLPVNQQNQIVNAPPQFQGNQIGNNVISPQYPNPSSNQFQQPVQPIVQYQQPQFSLLSLLFRPFSQLFNPQPNYGNQPQPFQFPFKREFRAVLAFFARIITTILPVLRTLDYQITPILTDIGNFRYNDHTNTNNYNNQRNVNYPQNTQGYATTQNNPYPGNPYQPSG